MVENSSITNLYGERIPRQLYVDFTLHVPLFSENRPLLSLCDISPGRGISFRKRAFLCIFLTARTLSGSNLPRKNNARLEGRPSASPLCRLAYCILTAKAARTLPLKTCHRHVFLTVQTLSGSNPSTSEKHPQSKSLDGVFGALGGIRTPDLLVRSQALYPTELQAHFKLPTYVTTFNRKNQPDFKKRYPVYSSSLPTFSISSCVTPAACR